MNDSNQTMLRFRESFRGYNKDDVNAYIEQINLRFSRREAELNEQISRLQSACGNDAAPTVQEEASHQELEALREALAKSEAEREEMSLRLEKMKDKAVADSDNAEKSRLYDSMSAQVGNILIVANSNADKILSDAKGEAERIRSEAAYDAEKCRLSAQQKMDGMIRELDIKLKNVADRCLEEYKLLAAEAGMRFGEITDDMKARTSELLSSTEQRSRELERQIVSDYASSSGKEE